MPASQACSDGEPRTSHIANCPDECEPAPAEPGFCKLPAGQTSVIKFSKSCASVHESPDFAAGCYRAAKAASEACLAAVLQFDCSSECQAC